MRQLLCVLGMIALIIAGCSKKPVVDTGRLEKAFKASDSASQALAGKVAAAIKDKNYRSAMATLQKLLHQPKLTTEQQQAVLDAMTALQQLMIAPAQKPPSPSS